MSEQVPDAVALVLKARCGATAELAGGPGRYGGPHVDALYVVRHPLPCACTTVAANGSVPTETGVQTFQVTHIWEPGTRETNTETGG